jgi:uncharacterized membrane protein YqgA involved in biofilm formation
MVRGAGTALNVATVLVGSGVGTLAGDRLASAVREAVTTALGLTTLLLAALDAAAVRDAALVRSVGGSAPVLVVLGSLVLGGALGGALRLQQRLDALSQRLLGRGHPAPVTDSAAGAGRAAEGFLAASLLFCVGPLTVLGSVQDGLGHGVSLLAVKSALDGFASVALAASYGPAVALAALTVLVVQGSLTAASAALGGVLTAAQLAAVTATGGLLLAGVAARLLALRTFAMADLLPALVLAAPLATLAGLAHRG